MDFIKKSYSSLLILLAEAVLGIFMIVKPELLRSVVTILIGVLLILVGTIALVKYFFLDSRGASPVSRCVMGIISVLVGVLCLIFNGKMGKAFIIVYGAILILNAAYKVYAYVTTRKATGQASFFQLISGLVALIVGVVLIVWANETVNLLWILAGIALLVEAVIDAVAAGHVYKLLTD